jgi:hypothetical protein
MAQPGERGQANPMLLHAEPLKYFIVFRLTPRLGNLDRPARGLKRTRFGENLSPSATRQVRTQKTGTSRPVRLPHGGQAAFLATQTANTGVSTPERPACVRIRPARMISALASLRARSQQIQLTRPVTPNSGRALFVWVHQPRGGAINNLPIASIGKFPIHL